ncbi:MAG: hypothetical protein ACR2K2_11150 [Mycobacteriales bacterium]
MSRTRTRLPPWTSAGRLRRWPAAASWSPGWSLRELELRWLPASPGVLALVEAEVRTPSSRLVTLRRTKGLGALATWRRGGLDFAPAERAVIDASRELTSLQDIRGVVLGAVADGWADVADLRRVLDATQRNGSGRARRAVVDAERGCASPPEAELVDALIGCGRPFYVNPALLVNGRLLGSPDVWLPGLGLGGEVESKERHGSDEDTESTYDRHERMTSPGIELVHLSVRRIRRDVNEAARHLLDRADVRSRLVRPEPAGLVVVPRGPLLR